MIRWWLPPEQREEEKEVKEKKKRNKYRWGAKDYLRTFEIGEKRLFNGEFKDWRNLACVACYMKRDYGCQFSFRQIDGEKYVIRIH